MLPYKPLPWVLTYCSLSQDIGPFLTWGVSLPGLSFFMCRAEILAAEMLYKQAMLCFCTLVEVRSSPLFKKKKTYSIVLYWC